MKKQFSLLLLLLYISIVLSTCGSSSNFAIKKNEKANNIKFVPEKFQDIELGYYYETKENSCSPIFREEMRTANSIAINTPEKIVYDTNGDNSMLTIPLCAIYSISQRRGLKYDKLSAKILHIKKIGEETVYFGEIRDKDESPIILPPGYHENEKKRQERIKEAQNYSDDELEQQDLAIVNYLNINLTEYVDIPLKSGVYEIYLSFYGLESNRTVVEILINK